MAQFYTLEEAAEKLGMSPSDLKRRLETEWRSRNIRPFRDGNTLRYKAADIDELHRMLNDSDPGIPDSDSELDLDLPLNLDDGPPPPPVPRSGKMTPAKAPPADEPLILGGMDDDIFLAPDDTAPPPIKAKKTGDSDVKLEKASPRPLPENTPTDEVELDFAAPQSAPPSGKQSPSKTGPITVAKDEDSEFELTLDSDSDFALTMDDEEVSLGQIPPNDGGQSSIKDSGISLEKRKGESGKQEAIDPDSIDFELDLEGASSSRLGSSSGKKKVADSDSEFELTLDDDIHPTSEETIGFVAADEPKEKDIFETDFDIPALDDESASEAVSLEEGDTDLDNSDFDLALDESGSDDASGSQAVELYEDDAVDEVDFDDAQEEGPSASKALRNVRSPIRDDDDEEEPVERAAVAAAPANWGLFPVLFMAPCTLVMLIGGLMSYELLHGMWGYQQPYKATSTVTKSLAEIFDVAPKE